MFQLLQPESNAPSMLNSSSALTDTRLPCVVCASVSVLLILNQLEYPFRECIRCDRVDLSVIAHQR